MKPTDHPRYPAESIDKVSKQCLQILDDAIETDPKITTVGEALCFNQVAILRITALIISHTASIAGEPPEVVRDRLIDAIKGVQFEAIH